MYLEFKRNPEISDRTQTRLCVLSVLVARRCHPSLALFLSFVQAQRSRRQRQLKLRQQQQWQAAQSVSHLVRRY